MRIRFPFAAGFVVLLLLASGGGLLPHSVLPSAPSPVQQYVPPHADKFMHFITFFALSFTFYFIFDTSRRRCLHLALLVCTLGLSVGSEVVQGLLPNDRDFDPFDVVANVVGSSAAVFLCTWYHKRMNERRRQARFEGAVGDDVELGGLVPRDGTDGQETGVTSNRTVEEELDNWDENAADEDWDQQDDDTAGDGGKKGAGAAGVVVNGSATAVPPLEVKKVAVD